MVNARGRVFSIQVGSTRTPYYYGDLGKRHPSTTPRCYARTERTPDNPALLRANGTNRAGVIFMPDCADGCSTPGAELAYA